MTDQRQGDRTEYIQGLTRRQLDDLRRIFVVMGACGITALADELEEAAGCGKVTDVVICIDQRGVPQKLKTTKSRSLVR